MTPPALGAVELPTEGATLGATLVAAVPVGLDVDAAGEHAAATTARLISSPAFVSDLELMRFLLRFAAARRRRADGNSLPIGFK
jgi:hypothetical protein